MRALSVSAAAIFVNWGLYVWLVQQHRVMEASLAYFRAPLATVLVGQMFGERLARLQWIAVSLAAIGVFIQGVATREPP